MNNNINIELLKNFYVVAKYKNITKASEVLLISQSALSKSIKNIENQLGCNLFVRSKKGVELTKQGEILFESTEKIIDILNKDLSKITNTKTINILVGQVLANNILFPYIHLFKKKYPNVQIKISCTTIEGIMNKIKNREVDFALGYYLDNLDDNYEQRKIIKELHPIFVCNNSYHQLLQGEIDIHELEKVPYIISAKGSTSYQFALDYFKTNNLNIEPAMEILGTSLITHVIKSGLGISILTEEFIQDELNKHELYKIQVNKPLDNRYLSIITNKNQTTSEEIDYFIDLLLNKNI